MVSAPHVIGDGAGPLSMYTCATYISLSFLACTIIHHYLSPRLSTLIVPTYGSLKRNKRMEWHSRVVSSVHAIAVSAVCFYALLSEREIWHDRIQYDSNYAIMGFCITIGYFICDMITMPMYWRGKNLIIYEIHHGIATFAFLHGVINRGWIFYGTLRLTSETSTPFTNLRWFFLTVGHTHEHKKVAVTTIVFAFLFFLLRNWVILPYWILVYLDYGTEKYYDQVRIAPMGDWVWLSTALCIDILNIYWGPAVYKSSHKATKVMRKHFRVRYMRSTSPDSDDSS